MPKPALAERIKAIRAPQPYGLSIPALPERAEALPEPLQDIARQYLGARQRMGDFLLDACRYLSEARALAQHGDWLIFLEAIGLDESRARAQIRIHEEAQRDPAFAEHLRTGFLSEAVARELLPAPAEVRQEVLSRGNPPTLKDVRDAKRASTPDLPPPESRSQQHGPGQPPPEPWPEAPEGWRWNRRGAPAHLIGPDGWQTRDYNYPERALAEAQRRILSQPKAEHGENLPAPSATPRTDDHLPAHWFGPTRAKFATTAELAKWCAEQRERLSADERALLAEDARQMIAAMEALIDVL